MGHGIVAKGGEAAVWVFDSSVERCGGAGIWLPNGNGSGQRVLNNTVRDCGGDGINMDGIGTAVSGNRIERCGRGIVRRTNGGAEASGNVVLNCVGDGLITATATGNTVVGCGGDGISPPAESYSGGPVGPVSAGNNVIAFNRGVGIARGGGNVSCNLVWQNGIDSKLGATYADPQFCDLAGGDLRVASSSPALAGACGQIGALGAGCSARIGLAAQSETGEPDVGPQFGITTRGRMALVTLAGSELASLDVLDVAGRRLSRTTLSSSREVAIEAPVGVVFLRLEQGGRRSTAKVVVIQ